jgi:hypothetical protein
MTEDAVMTSDIEVAREGAVLSAAVARAEEAHAMSKAPDLAAKPRAALLATRRLMRGDPEALRARMAEEMHAFSATLRPPAAHAAFQAFLSTARK